MQRALKTNIQVITERTDIVCCEATRKCNIEIRLKASDICQHTMPILILVEVSHDAVKERTIATSVTPNILRIIFPLGSEAVSISICWKTKGHFRLSCAETVASSYLFCPAFRSEEEEEVATSYPRHLQRLCDRSED